jgi:tetratricopeptide (TPR) repeat protein
MTENQVKITSHTQDYSIKINLNGETYVIDSEDLGIQNPQIIIRAYQKGKIIYSHKVNYEDILNRPDFNKRLSELLKHQQQIAIEALKMAKVVPGRTHKKDDMEEKENIVIQKRTYKDYVNEVEALIRRNSQKEALVLLIEALEHYPNNPILLSYRGYIEAFVNRRYAEGIKICRQSFKILKDQMPLVEGFFLPVLHLNLGRTYLIANKKKLAYFSFQKGIEIDKKNDDIFKELKKLGVRRKSLFPFLKRSNPLNKYIGILTYELQKKTMRP